MNVNNARRAEKAWNKIVLRNNTGRKFSFRNLNILINAHRKKKKEINLRRGRQDSIFMINLVIHYWRSICGIWIISIHIPRLITWKRELNSRTGAFKSRVSARCVSRDIFTCLKFPTWLDLSTGTFARPFVPLFAIVLVLLRDALYSRSVLCTRNKSERR